MKESTVHLHDDEILDALTSTAPTGVRRHLSECPLCAEEAAAWRRRLGELRTLAAEQMSDSELHRLLVLYRELGPRAGGLATWVASLLRCSLQPAAVRGSFEMVELDAGPYRVLIQLQPDPEHGTVNLHGQLLGDSVHAPGAGRVAFATSGGVGVVGDIDRHGEFDLPGLPAGSYSASWWTPAGRITLDEISVTADDGS